MDVITPFLSGLVAAFTPCVVVLFPLLLYRFFSSDRKDWGSYFLLVFGFILSYVIFGFLMGQLLTSAIQNGIKLGLGILFIILGILSILNKLNPMNIPLIRNPFLLGAVFATIIAFNPCTIPYLSIIITFTDQAKAFISLGFFGLGIIMPSLLFAFFGNTLYIYIKNKGHIMEKINKALSVLLLVIGIYILVTIKTLGKYDIYVVGLLMLAVFGILGRAFFMFSKRRFFRWQSLLILSALLLFTAATIVHCNHHLTESSITDDIVDSPFLVQSNEPSCSDNVLDCPVCKRCITLFTIGAILGFIGAFFLDRKYSS